MQLVNFTLSVYLLAAGCAFFIAFLLLVMGKFIKFLNLKDDATATIPGTPAGQIMPAANSSELEQAAIAIAIAASRRQSTLKK